MSPPAPGEGASPPGSPPSGAAPTGFIQEKVFVEQAPGFVVKDKDGGELVTQLAKSLYGLAQSPGNWFYDT